MTTPSPKPAGLTAAVAPDRPRGSHHASGSKHAAHHHGHAFTTLVAGASHRHAERASLPATVTGAVQTAIAKEGVPATWQAPLQFIIGQESNGQVGASNHSDSARGLFQLTRASYHLNPHGAQSFGDPVEEAQGGIRYIQRRYQTADNAAQFWQRHGWY